MTVDEQVKKHIVEQLYWDDRVNAADVRVECSEGRVVLSGTVANYAAKRAAENDALKTPGVAAIENRLEIFYPAETDLPSDQEISSRIASRLLWDSDIDAANIDVFVEGGIAVLEGTVDSYWKKVKAELFAFEIYGVTSVENKLAVVPTRDILDEAVAESITAALSRNSTVDANAIDVGVEEGRVVLAGSVEDWNAFLIAQDIAAYTLGVVDVTTNLVVRQPERV